MRVTALAGGVGGAKLLVGLTRVVAPRELTAVVNVADDADIYGVRVSPDVDIVTYWLAGIADTKRGWGIEGDTFTILESLERLGHETWFSLGDRDLATCLFRTERLRHGATLTAVTREIAGALGVGPRVIPATDDLLRTHVVTSDGRVLAFQEYFVKERTAPAVSEVRYEGMDEAKPGPDVIEAIETADVVVVCPSNPVLSVAPIIDLAGVRAALRDHPNVVAVSPIVGGVALKGPADRMLASLGVGSSARAVAGLYRDFCKHFLVDEVDADAVRDIETLGMRVHALDTIMTDHDASERLARALLERVT
jgi:LPPG:FO 2-phospho-L-lactate transferase